MAKYEENQRFKAAVEELLNSGRASSKAWIARKLGVHQQIIYDIYKDKLKVSRDILEKFEQEYGISKELIMFGGETPAKDEDDWQGIKLPADIAQLLNKQMDVILSQQETINRQCSYICKYYRIGSKEKSTLLYAKCLGTAGLVCYLI